MMKTVIEELFDHYGNFAPEQAFQKEIDEAHQSLIRSLEKPERKLVLRIIDNKDLIAGARARDSFECGFWLAWRLLTQLHIYENSRLLENSLKTNGCFSMTKEKEDEKP
ncbi:hypothetical protein [Oscillibacter sp.]|uniref:hypothetical protein n=1 Tax=Oscillibacter sp. TaxID=1945593 RepID=UPI0028AD23A3|nr:hypothetical protein [Oscillibacter sp.]